MSVHQQLIQNQLNEEDKLSFVVHVGDESLDILGCSNQILTHYIANNFNQSKYPFIYTPGDNEWVDCIQHAAANPFAIARDPLESLAFIRSMLTNKSASTASQGESFGMKKLSLERQNKKGNDPTTPFDESKFAENQRWIKGDVMFVTIHSTGSLDNCMMQVPGTTLPNYTPAQIGNFSNVPTSCSEEKKERQAADIAWLQHSFAKAKTENLKGMVIFTQADFNYNLDTNDTNCPSTLDPVSALFCKAFIDYRSALRQEVLNWNKPVLLIHGDRHQFVIQKPQTDAPNFTRVMTFGEPDTGWLRVTVDTSTPEVFTVECGGIVQVDSSGNYSGSTCRDPVILNPSQ